MQDSEMRDKLEKIIKAYEELQAKMSDPAVLAESEGIQQAGKGILRPGRVGGEVPRVPAGLHRHRRGQGDARRPRHEGVRPGRPSPPHRGASFQLRRGHQVHAHPLRSGRREGHHRGDPRRVQAATRPPSSQATCSRCTSASAPRAEVEDRDSWTSALPRRAVTRKSSSRCKGDKVYSVMKFESGVHRVQRVPKTESQGRIHTSTATVAVLPEADEVEVDINRERPAHRCVPRRRPGRPVRQHDRLRRAHHAPADRFGRAVAGPEVTAAEQDRRDEPFCARASMRRCSPSSRPPKAPSACAQIGSGDRSREDPHLQRPAGPRDRPPHRLQLHLHQRAAGRRP